jgi:hypothetical protein
MRTSLNHHPEAQHPKSSVIHKLLADLPLLTGPYGRNSPGATRKFVSGIDICSRAKIGEIAARARANMRDRYHARRKEKSKGSAGKERTSRPQ